jgi:Domain of unknown function (DUF1707)
MTPQRAGETGQVPGAVDDHFRASDADRDRVAAFLRGHCAAGGITLEELDARLTATTAARTYAELVCVLADLPVPPPARQPARPQPAAGRPAGTLPPAADV